MDSILLADDDVEFAELLVEYLEEQGFQARAVHDGEAAITALTTATATAAVPAVVILDIMMPRLDGLQTLQQLRRLPAPLDATPVIMLTAKGDDIDRILGLELGADDYLAKPANPRELLARVKALLRRSQRSDFASNDSNTELRVGDITLYMQQREARIGNQPLALTSSEFDVLAELLQNAGAIVSKDSLAQAALGRKLGAYDRSLDMHIVNLRKKLGPLTSDQEQTPVERIKTVRNRGYLYAVAS